MQIYYAKRLCLKFNIFLGKMKYPTFLMYLLKSRVSVVEVRLESARPFGVAQALHGAILDLAHAFAGDAV